MDLLLNELNLILIINPFFPFFGKITPKPRCLKITKEVSINISNEASRQKFNKNAKNGFYSFWKPETCGQKVLPDRSLLKDKKLAKNAKIDKLKCDILSTFQILWLDFLVFKTCLTNFLLNEFWSSPFRVDQLIGSRPPLPPDHPGPSLLWLHADFWCN